MLFSCLFLVLFFCDASQDCFVLQKLTSDLLRLKCDSLMQRGDLHGWRFYQALMPKAGGCGILEEEPRGLPEWLWEFGMSAWIPALEAGDRQPQFVMYRAGYKCLYGTLQDGGLVVPIAAGGRVVSADVSFH